MQGGDEVAYLRDVIDASGEPVLDAGCGAGRLLLSFLRDGPDVDGCDVSPDMVTICRERASTVDHDVLLYEQPMYALDLPRRYGTIVVCGAFGLGTTQDQDTEALRRLHEHPLPGARCPRSRDALDGRRDVGEVMPDQRRELSVPWSSDETPRPDGSLLKTTATMETVDPLDRVVTRRVRYELWREGSMERGVHVLRERWHFPSELRLMLEVAGFRGIELRAATTADRPRATISILVFLARVEPERFCSWSDSPREDAVGRWCFLGLSDGVS